MPNFKDKNDREWSVSLDAPTIREVKTQCGIYLAAPDGTGYERMQADDCDLVNCLWVVCKEQAQKDQITEQQFGRALVGDAIDRARDAMLDAILDFFPSRNGRRELVRTLGQQTEAMRKITMQKAIAKMTDPAVHKRLIEQAEQQMDTALTPLSNATDSPESAASTPKA